MEIIFKDRIDAGTKLAEVLSEKITIQKKDIVLLALPRGGVPIADEISKRFRIPFDVLVVRKIGHPHNEEFGIGAITEDGRYWLNPLYLEVSPDLDSQIDKIVLREQKELKRRIQLYREGRPLPDLKDKVVILIDDGIATGVTAKIAVDFIKAQGAKEIVLAIPICASHSAHEIRKRNVQVIAVAESSRLMSVGQYYSYFNQVTDEEVRKMLRDAQRGYQNHQQGDRV
jgi:putative phosphoribosyl transferase